MLRKFISALTLVSMWMLLTPALAQDKAQEARRGWVDRLMSPPQPIERRSMMQELFQLPADTLFAVVKEAWPRIKDLNVRSDIERFYLQGAYFGNTGPILRTRDAHILDMLDLIILEEPPPAANGKADQPDYLKAQAFQEARSMALQPLKDVEEYKAWRKTTGEKSISEMIAENSRRAVKELNGATTERRLELLKLFAGLRYWSGTSAGSNNGVTFYKHTAEGTTAIRRAAMLDAGFVLALGSLLNAKNPPEIRIGALRCMAKYAPDDDALQPFEKDLQRELPALVESAKSEQVPGVPPVNAISTGDCAILLTGFSTDWSADLTAKLLRKGLEGGPPDFSITNELQHMHNPRLIPTLIGIIDTPSPFGSGYNPYENILNQLTRAGIGNGMGRPVVHDSLWWRVWWHDNKKNFPPDVQKIPIPTLRRTGATPTVSASSTSTRNRLERVFVSEDERRSYWLISANVPPPVRMSEQAKEAIGNSGIRPLAAVKQERAGLIVALTDEDASDPAVIDQWLDVSDALDRRYYVAVVIRPRWPGVPVGRWLLSKDRSTAPLADFTTETFVDEIARQVESNIAIDPERVYLAAGGTAGTAAYACAFQSATPFRGFCLLSSPFRAALLPPPFAAKGRRFFIGLGLTGATGGDSLAAAAEPLLTRHSAKVRVQHVKDGSLTNGIREGVDWLER